MLGLEILYQDDSIVVVNKPAGLLSVPGRGEENQDCVVIRLQRLFPHCIAQPSVHRLDQDTSGLLVLTLTQEAHRELSRQFMVGEVYKEYQALLRGRVVASGWNHLELPFRLDVDNRPRQIYDEVHGKIGITDWKVLSYHRCSPETSPDKVLTRVCFVPRTGRTHQLRLHAMHEKGIGVPIQGDRLYGHRLPGERLMLHACLLRFTHPKTKMPVEFISPAPF
ncbi:MAG: RluA family pseudouridine synthase [Treponema sp.]|nr:RluA family pseudouridine synthase [Treponema sp.]